MEDPERDDVITYRELETRSGEVGGGADLEVLAREAGFVDVESFRDVYMGQHRRGWLWPTGMRTPMPLAIG